MENSKKRTDCDDSHSSPWVGRWTIDIKSCTGCGECVDACTRCLLKISIEHRKVEMIDETRCPQCGDCVRACAYLAIELT